MTMMKTLAAILTTAYEAWRDELTVHDALDGVGKNSENPAFKRG